MSPCEADAFRVLLGPEEIVVDFGVLQEGSAGADELTVALSQRVLMGPETASRLVVALRESAERAGAAPAEAAGGSPPLEALLEPTRELSSSRAAPPPAAQRAGRLLAAVRGIGASHTHERSFRLSRGTLRSNRFLLSIGRSALGSGAESVVVDICRGLSMPSAYLEEVVRSAHEASCFHFGFEQDGDRCWYKVYLERAEALQAGSEAKPGADPLLLHLAFKWDAEDREHRVVTRYLWHPALSMDELKGRIDAIYGPRASEAAGRDVCQDILGLAAAHMAESDIQYLEVVEDEGRRSFDLNFYDAGLLVRDVYPLLSRLRGAYDVPAGRFQALYDQIKTRPFGHLAGGVHREGEDFATVYYGVEHRAGSSPGR